MRPSISKKAYAKIFHLIETLQKESPREPVTQKRVYAKLKKPRLSSRHVRRAFRKLRNDGKVIRDGRGQYWLPEYLEKKLEYMKRQLELEERIWGDVNKLLQKKIADLELKLHEQELLYEDIIEQYEHEEILEELKKKELRARNKK